MGDRSRRFKNEIFNEEICYELTPCGVTFCAGTGILAELLILFCCGIQLTNVPLPVFGFLWLLCGILISGILIGIEMLMAVCVGRTYKPTEPVPARCAQGTSVRYRRADEELRKAA